MHKKIVSSYGVHDRLVRVHQLLSTQATTKTALAHAIGMDVSQLSKLLPILFDVPAEGRGEFMTTAQDLRAPCHIRQYQKNLCRYHA